MSRPLAFATLLTLAWTAFALQAEAQVSASSQEIECHSNKDYLVVGKPHKDSVGMQFAVTALNGKPAPKKCTFDAKKADFVIGKPDEPLWFEKQAGHLLVLSASTGPQGRLIVHDLKSRKSVLDVPADDYALEGDKITFWQRTAAATRKNCKAFDENKKNGMSSVISTQKVFDGKTNTVTDLGKSRCDTTQ